MEEHNRLCHSNVLQQFKMDVNISMKNKIIEPNFKFWRNVQEQNLKN